MTAKAWIQGLLTAFITAFSTAAIGVLALPTVFNMSKDGLYNIGKMTLVPALISVFTFLKQSPLPGALLSPGDKATLLDPHIALDGTISGSSATLVKATDPTAPKP